MQLQVPGVVEADQDRRSIRVPLHDGDRAVGLIEPDPPPHGGVERVADEPRDHKVVRDQPLMPVVVAGDTKVLGCGLQGGGVFVALVVGHAVKPAKHSARILATLFGRWHRCSITDQFASRAAVPVEAGLR